MPNEARSFRLADRAKTIRSKNAGVDKVTFDVIFRDREDYEQVKTTGALSRRTVQQLFGIADEQISDFVHFDPANAVKFTIYRERSSGGPGDSDVFGAQQYAPLLDLVVPPLRPDPDPKEREVLDRYGEQIDALMTLDLGGRSVAAQLYRYARSHVERPLAITAACALKQAFGYATTVLIATGWPDRPHIDPSIAETDGPLGAAVLARALYTGCKATPIFVIEDALRQPMVEVVQAAGFRVLEPAAALKARESSAPMAAAAVIGFPTTDDEAERAASELIEAYAPGAVIAIEKGGINEKNTIHTSRGAETTEHTAKVDYLVREASNQGVLTVGVGDGGNEIGMGNIRREIEANIPYGQACLCGCGGGIAPTTVTDHLVVAAISNWGAYGIAAALAIVCRDRQIFHNPAAEERLLRAAARAGLIDGIDGVVQPSVDGVGLASHMSFVTLLSELVKIGIATAESPEQSCSSTQPMAGATNSHQKGSDGR